MNSTSVIYVSATIYENNTPLTSYESELCQFYVSIPNTLTYTSVITRTLEENKCFWFKFVAPQDSRYIFEISGTTDTYGELFSKVVAGHSLEYRMMYDDDSSNQGNNFKIAYTLKQGDIVFLRVRGWNWAQIGEFTLAVSCIEHIHQYDYSYTYKDALQHNSYCSCGQITIEPHNWYWDKTGNRCNDCGYLTTSPIIVAKPMSKNNKYLICNVSYFKEDDD